MVAWRSGLKNCPPGRLGSPLHAGRSGAGVAVGETWRI
jgi:hypothetical protein